MAKAAIIAKALPTSVPSVDALHERIDRRQEILDRIAAAERKLGTAQGRVTVLRGRLDEARNAAWGIRAAIEREVAESSDASFKGRESDHAALEIAEARIRSAAPQVTETEETVRSLRAEIEHLKNVELPTCDAEIGLDELAAHMDAVKQAKARVHATESHLAHSQEEANRLRVSIPTTRALDAEREALAGRVCLGEGTQDELNALDREHAPAYAEIEREAAQGMQKIAALESAQRGLQRLLGDAIHQAEVLQRRTPAAIEQYLFAEARRAHAGYTTHMAKLVEAFIELVAIDCVLKERGLGGKHGLVPDVAQFMILPGIELPGSTHGTRLQPDSPDGAYRTAHDSHNQAVAGAVHRIKGRLADIR
ncbi:MAG: hypothetical protein IT530_21135 [Burkholderiales bacterium]|nr:hypothetical protein [Burkholderiales bacterium]